jgi:RNA-dependent RNA polymerase
MPVYGGFRGSSDSILRRIRSILENGIRIGARKYEFVLFSSSQIRRASAWFIDYENSGLSRECILAKIGDVSSVRSPAKYSSIIGLSLSTTFEALPLKDHEFEVQDDICSSDKKFIFTDGCGLISFEFAQAISNRLNLNYVPSAFQIRFRGFKGMLVRSKIDYGKKAIFRKSMKKFEIPETNLEICSFSKAHPCFLNRQIIVLLTSLGVRDVIILDMYQEFLTLVRDCSLNRQNALNFLNIGCPGVSESSRNSLKVLFSNGFFEENDPFLIKGLESYKALSLLQLKTKSRIMVKNGALLKGVSDPSGILQEDEVILQLAQSSNLEPVRTILGNVVVTRNPCLHPGDIRVLKAVSPPEGFEYLVDVIVFSVKGSRDNPSKIAGGDLDGDEYSVYWDPRLMPDMIFEPMQEIAKSVLDIGHGVSKSDVIQFFLDSIKNASLGIICNAHQGWADHEHEGALSFECLDLAVLGSIAVDYPKTGIPAVIDRRYRLESFPDFMENRSKASYASHKVLGKIYRDVCKLIESKSSKFLDNSFEGVNPNLVYRGYENYLESAFGTKLSWDSHMFSIMSQNGIKHEEQLFFGTVQKFHRTYQKDRDIAVKVEQHIQKLKRGFRKSFFEEFIPNFNDLDPIEFDHCIRNLLIDPPKEMLEKASAWYVCAHSKELYENNWSAKSRLFSFPWIIFDVLVLVLQRTSKIE